MGKRNYPLLVSLALLLGYMLLVYSPFIIEGMTSPELFGWFSAFFLIVVGIAVELLGFASKRPLGTLSMFVVLTIVLIVASIVSDSWASNHYQGIPNLALLLAVLITLTFILGLKAFPDRLSDLGILAAYTVFGLFMFSIAWWNPYNTSIITTPMLLTGIMVWYAAGLFCINIRSSIGVGQAVIGTALFFAGILILPTLIVMTMGFS